MKKNFVMSFVLAAAASIFVSCGVAVQETSSSSTTTTVSPFNYSMLYSTNDASFATNEVSGYHFVVSVMPNECWGYTNETVTFDVEVISNGYSNTVLFSSTTNTFLGSIVLDGETNKIEDVTNQTYTDSETYITTTSASVNNSVINAKVWNETLIYTNILIVEDFFIGLTSSHYYINSSEETGSAGTNTRSFTSSFVTVENTNDYDFYISAFELTGIEYRSFSYISNVETMFETYGETTPACCSNGAQNVSLSNAMAFCNFLSALDGLSPAYDLSDPDADTFYLSTNATQTTDPGEVEGWRLPTADEWEFAAIGGQLSQGYTYSGSDSINDVSWNYQNSDYMVHPVGNLAPNELGIYDMSGNQWENVFDVANGEYTRTGGSLANDDLGMHEPGNLSCDTVSLGESCPGQGYRVIRTKLD